MICLKIRTFVVSATTPALFKRKQKVLWFAWKFVPLWYQQQRYKAEWLTSEVVICLKIRTFVVSATTQNKSPPALSLLWFAWKFVPLWYQQQPLWKLQVFWPSCDLLENSYLCGISNNMCTSSWLIQKVVICLKIRTFVVSATTIVNDSCYLILLWFAWKFVPLWYQQQQAAIDIIHNTSCDLLENSYLCGISNNMLLLKAHIIAVVICLKIRTFVVSATTRFRW